MSTVLNLFPARVKFVNDDGTLTPEAYRTFQVLSSRVGGPLGNNGVDVFGDISGIASINSAITDTVIQSVIPSDYSETVTQPILSDFQAPDVMQPPSSPVAYTSGGAAPAGGVGTAAGGWDTAAHRDSAITLLNNIRTALINAGLMT